MYVSDISILKPFNNVYCNNSRYLKKLCQYNKNLLKHQTKINTAISTN